MSIYRHIKDWLSDTLRPGGENGQTLVEYGLLVTLLAMAAVLILGVVGQDVVGLFTGLSTHLQNTTP